MAEPEDIDALQVAMMDMTFKLLEAGGFDAKPINNQRRLAMLSGVAQAAGAVVLSQARRDPERFRRVWVQLGESILARNGL